MSATSHISSPAPVRDGSTARDLGIDAYRAFAMFVVVAWHWVFTIVSWGERGPRVDNPISFVPHLGYLTWVLQVMPLFFLVGGHVTVAALRDLDTPAVRRWSARRLRRLCTPAMPLVGALFVAHLVADTVGATSIARAIVLTATPLWFLAVYLVIVALVPLVHSAAQRAPIGHVAALISACVLWDVLRFSGALRGAVLWISMALVWLTVHQMGTLLDRISRRAAATLVVGGLGALLLATTVGPYPVSMVGTTTDRISNMGPPTAVLLALAAVQLGVVVLTRGWVTAMSRRYESLVAGAARHAMPVYLWHMVGFATCVVAARALGAELVAEPTWSWWLTRPLWVLGPALVARPLVRWSAGTAAGRR